MTPRAASARDRAVDAATVAGFSAAWRLVRLLPPRAAYRLFDAAADTTWRRDTRDVRRLRANYARLRPELDAAALDDLVRAGVRSYMRYWCEAFRLPDMDASDVTTTFRAEGDEPVRTALAAGRGVACFLGHMGNWDLAGAWCAHELGPLVTVAERLRPEELFDRFVAFRRRIGIRVLPHAGSEPPFPRLLDAVTHGIDGRPAVVPLLADRDLTHRGVEVHLAGHRARMATGPAVLALRTGAALHPVSVHYEPAPHSTTPGGWRCVATFHPRVPDPGHGTQAQRVAAMTQACADALAGALREHTQDWHMMQRVFVDGPAELAR